MLDLTRLPWRYLDAYGRAKVAEICEVGPNVISMWISRGQFPVGGIQKLIEFDPTPLHEQVKPLYVETRVQGQLAILLPSNRKADPHTWSSLTRMYKPGEMLPPEPFNFNSIYHVRNMAAQWFLDRNIPWSYWSDDDTVAPCGDAVWFKKAINKPQFPDVFAGLNTILRLLVHQKKMVGGCYVSKRAGGEPQFGGGVEMKALVKRGPTDRVVEAPWIGFGATLIHRDVFLDIMKQFPEMTVTNEQVKKRLGYSYNFFQPVANDFGDDISFCRRATESGHKIHVDLAVMPAHVGEYAYTYADL